MKKSFLDDHIDHFLWLIMDEIDDPLYIVHVSDINIISLNPLHLEYKTNTFECTYLFDEISNFTLKYL